LCQHERRAVNAALASAAQRRLIEAYYASATSIGSNDPGGEAPRHGRLWADLSRDEAQFESPAWHGDVLRERVEAVKSGKETFMDWETAKKQLREKLK